MKKILNNIICRITNSITILILLLTACTTSAPKSAEAAFKEHLTWKSEVEKISETEYKVKFICSLEDEWHTYSQFTKEGGPLPTQFRFDKNNDIELIGKVEEVGKKHSKFDELFGVDVTSFDGNVTYVQRVIIKKPNAILKGEFDGQVCKDEEGCMPFGPEKFAIRFDGKVVKDLQVTITDTAQKKAGTTIIDTTSSNAIQPQHTINPSNKFDFSFAKNDCSVGETKKDLSYLWIFIISFLSGLAALFTPCVFPLIPLTVNFFTKGGKDKKEGLKKAFIYGLSIIVIYVALGLIVSTVFGADSLQWFSTSMILNLVFFIVFIIFGISFLGYFEITLPASWANKTDTLSSKGGFVGIFFMAFTLAIVSFSCTGPIVGTLLVQTAGKGNLAPAIGMFGFALALALPFMLFAMFPQWLQSLPKSGGWMNRIKVVLGFIEIALAFKFLSTVDLTQGWNVLKWEPFLIIWIIIFIALALYSFGFIKFPHDNPKEKPSLFLKSFGLLNLAFVAYLFYGLITYQSLNLLSGIVPPSTYNFFHKEKSDLIHFDDYEKGLQYAKEHDMPILIDFTGHGCVNCRRIEDKVWSNSMVKEQMKKYVIVSLYTDDRKSLPENEWYSSNASGRTKEIKTVGGKWADFQIKNFQTIQQPQYILINNKEQLLNQPVAYDFSKEKSNYISFLKCGLKMNAQLK
jgi:thiol:disulfide interchange protein DsbD